MALQVLNEHKHGRIMMKSGGIYSFSYQGFQNDAAPLIVMINNIQGIHPTTGHQWHLIQGLNLHYIPRKDRQIFAKDWVAAWTYSKQMQFTWKTVQRHFPYLQFAIRRYFTSPMYYISNLEEIPVEKFEERIVGTWMKDFSRETKNAILKMFKQKARKLS